MKKVDSTLLNALIHDNKLVEIYVYYQENRASLDLGSLKERHIQYLAAACLDQADKALFWHTINIGIQKFAQSVSLLNLMYLAYFKADELEDAYRIALQCEYLSRKKGAVSQKWDDRIRRLEARILRRQDTSGPATTDVDTETPHRIASTRVVFCDGDLMVRFHDNHSKVTFMTFWGDRDPIAASGDPFRDLFSHAGYAQAFILKQGFNLISVIKRDYNFYQDLERDKLHSIVRECLQGAEKIFTYGGSGGGYAALYYAVGLDNAMPIAFSPRIRIDPVTGLKLHDNVRYPEFVHPPISTWNCPNRAFVIYDPMLKSDSMFIDHRVKPCFPNAKYLKAPFSGHGAFMFAELGVVKSLVTHIVNQLEFPDGFYEPRLSKIYHYQLANYLFSRKKVSSACVVALRALRVLDNTKARFTKVDIYNLLVKSLLKVGQASLSHAIFDEFKGEGWFASKKNRYPTRAALKAASGKPLRSAPGAAAGQKIQLEA